ncbi:hypothetical protein GGS23DRAFT_563924 [Durotheca rogersii]|uniref:uncharacterized protein n=1 Tax=Durotheca rogersii TaxID=419775 RepID=UPI002220AEE2|nr:uncharacterized protein GGS23DRAFT_563924 [Durotheca rogersii]KAI5864339.1 hypothetical protein GGS23DRAFT_563924 [Durotheca rogersii]
MSHPQPPIPQRQFSPQHSPGTPTYQLPPTKRAKLSPGPPSNPASPYPTYAASPQATTPAAQSPAPSQPTNPQAPPSSLSATPYQQINGRSTSVGHTLTMPSASPTTTQAPPRNSTPTTSNFTHAIFSTAELAPITTDFAALPTLTPAITSMGPPTNPTAASSDALKQGSKPTTSKTVSYEMDDMLMGTGIDLDEEAEYLNNIESRGFPHHRPGKRDTFYGAGPANQPAQPTDAQTQEDHAAETADRVWNEAAERLAVSRSHEVANHLLEPGVVHKRLQEVASKFGLGLNLDLKPDGKSQYIGRFANPSDFPKPELKVLYQKGPDGGIVQTLGSFVPKDAFLIDQIALLSIGTKQRLRELLSDANKVATIRQTSSHGVVPEEWIDAAAPQPAPVGGAEGQSPRTGAESAVSPRANPHKRSADDISNGLPTPVSEAPASNFMVEAMLSINKASRNAEEGRLRKRLKRAEKVAEKDKEGGDGGSRAGSVAPGTPGSMTAEQGESKAPTKKESKKAAKLAEANSTTVNQTLGLFAGGKKKRYSWMTSAGGTGGASTPRPQGGGASGAPGSTAGGGNRATRGPLTKASVTHIGQFREDSDKGKNIQLRDWVAVLEERGFDHKSLQQAYGLMDKSTKAITESTT